eukprot:COSAG02_NODE_960_length_15642_cov_34.870424_8_plen_153_part_00
MCISTEQSRDGKWIGPSRPTCISHEFASDGECVNLTLFTQSSAAEFRFISELSGSQRNSFSAYHYKIGKWYSHSSYRQKGRLGSGGGVVATVVRCHPRSDPQMNTATLWTAHTSGRDVARKLGNCSGNGVRRRFRVDWPSVGLTLMPSVTPR